MKEQNWIYINNEDNSSRYALGTKGFNTLFCFGINPSYACPERLDPTLKNVQSISKNNGYDSWIMFNIYPKRDTHFENLNIDINNNDHIKNIEVISDITEKCEVIDIWLAFGNHIYDRKYLIPCLIDIYEKLKNKNVRWFSIGCNKSGAPKHPLYQSKNSQLIAFDMIKYIESLCD